MKKQSIQHSDSCQCPRCANHRKSTPPPLVATWYEASSYLRQVLDVEFTGYFWLVNFQVTHEHQMRHDWFSVDQWNLYCKAWRKDLFPEGVEGKGWRSLEQDQKRTFPEQGVDWGT